MLSLIQSSALAVLVAASAIVPLPVNAQTLELDLGGGSPQMRLRDSDRCDPRYENCYRGDRSMGRMCTEDRALDKAERMGLDRVRVVSAGRRTVEVRGRTQDGDRAHIVFGRQPGCPVIG